MNVPHSELLPHEHVKLFASKKLSSALDFPTWRGFQHGLTKIFLHTSDTNSAPIPWSVFCLLFLWPKYKYQNEITPKSCLLFPISCRTSSYSSLAIQLHPGIGDDQKSYGWSWVLSIPFQTRKPDPKNTKVESRLLSSTVAFCSFLTQS